MFLPQLIPGHRLPSRVLAPGPGVAGHPLQLRAAQAVPLLAAALGAQDHACAVRAGEGQEGLDHRELQSRNL